jgi:hypothetical protein
MNKFPQAMEKLEKLEEIIIVNEVEKVSLSKQARKSRSHSVGGAFGSAQVRQV